MEHKDSLLTVLLRPQARAPMQQMRCDICNRRLRGAISFVEETGDVPEPRQAWVLCGSCNMAVRNQLVRSGVQSPVKLRIAVGLVAAERTPAARRSRMGQLSDESWGRLFLWLFPITMIIHLAVIVAIAGWIR